MIITIPEDIDIRTHVEGGRLIDARLNSPDLPKEFGPSSPSKFVDFVCKTVLADAKFGSGMDQIYMALEIRKAIEGKGPRDTFELPKMHVDKVIEVLKAPTGGYLPLVAVHLVPFFEAFTRAQ